MKTAHFFAGCGGGLLADLILGHTPVLATDIDERRLCCIEKSGWFPECHPEAADIRKFNSEPWAGRVDIVAAGFPCQDISCAGSGKGIRGGSRSGLFFELVRHVAVIRPRLVFLENSPQIRTRGRDIVVRELVALGYSWRDGTLAASHVGAGHKRNRWWCLADNPDKSGCHGWARTGPECSRGYEFENGVAASADALLHRLERAVQLGGLQQADAETIQAVARYTDAWGWAPPLAGLCGMVHGFPDRMDKAHGRQKGKRIAALGNAQVPLQAALAFLLLTKALEEPTCP